MLLRQIIIHQQDVRLKTCIVCKMLLSKYCWALTRFILVWILLIPQRHQVRSKLGGNPTFEESTMTLTVRLLVCWGRRSLYTLLKGYRERLGGGRWEVACLDDRHSSGHHSGYHAGRHSGHHSRSLPPLPPRRHGEAEGGGWKYLMEIFPWFRGEEGGGVSHSEVRWHSNIRPSGDIMYYTDIGQSSLRFTAHQGQHIYWGQSRIGVNKPWVSQLRHDVFKHFQISENLETS